jgi:hypothetical protein
VLFGVHSEVAEHYGVSPEQLEPYDTTLDYLVAAAGGCSARSPTRWSSAPHELSAD